jgi:hypothetical protein
LLILQTTRAKDKLNNFLILSSCVFLRMFFANFVIFSHRLQKTLREDLLKEDTDSCFKRIPTPKLCKRRKANKRMVPKISEVVLVVTMTPTTVKKEQTMRTNSKISTLMKNQRTLKVKRKT